MISVGNNRMKTVPNATLENYVDYNNMKIELRHYNNYSSAKSTYVRQWKSTNKHKLLDLDNKDWMPKISDCENTSL